MYQNHVHAPMMYSSKANDLASQAMVITKGDIKIMFPSSTSNDGVPDEESDVVSFCTVRL